MNAPLTTPAAPETAAAPTQASKFQQALGMVTGTAEPEPPKAPAAPAVDDLKAARDQEAHLRHQRALLTEKKARETAEASLQAYKALDAKDPKAAMKLLRERGLTMEMLAKAAVDDDDPEPETETARELRELKEWRERKEAEEVERDAAGVRAQNVAALGEMLKAQADKFPALASFERAPQIIADRWAAYVKQNGDPEDPAEQAAVIMRITSDFHAKVSSDVDNILSGDAAFKAFLTRHKDRALAILGAKPSADPASEQGAGRSKGAPVVSSTATADAGARKTSPQTHKDKYAAALALAKQPG